MVILFGTAPPGTDEDPDGLIQRVKHYSAGPRKKTSLTQFTLVKTLYSVHVTSDVFFFFFF